MLLPLLMNIPGMLSQLPAGGDSTRWKLRRRKRGKLRYWWETEDLEEVVALEPAEALLEPVAVEALWEEQMALRGYIEDAAASRASQRVLDKLAQVDVYLQKRMEAETTRRLRVKKKLLLLLN